MRSAGKSVRIGQAMRREQFPLQDSACKGVFRGADRHQERKVFFGGRTGTDSATRPVDPGGGGHENHARWRECGIARAYPEKSEAPGDETERRVRRNGSDAG